MDIGSSKLGRFSPAFKLDVRVFRDSAIGMGIAVL
jgi:hypothetical protein